MFESFTIYELAALILILPLSYGLANFVKHWSNKVTAYQKQIDLLFLNYWDGNPDSEHDAWLRVRRQIINHSPTARELWYVDKKIQEIDKQSFLSKSYVTSNGDINLNENPPIIQFDDSQNF